MKNQLQFLLIMILGTYSVMCSQDTNLARVEYTYLPQANSANRYSRFKVFANYPIKMYGESTYFIVGAGYKYHNLAVNDPISIADKSSINEFHSAGVNLGYTFKFSEKWRFGAKVGILVSSNFEGDRLRSDDFIYSGAVYFIRTVKKEQKPLKTRWILGVRYSNPGNIEFPLPIIHYSNRFDKYWSFSVGSPKTNVKYYYNKKNTFQIFIGLDRFYANLQENQVVRNGSSEALLAENASMLNIIGALGYEHYFTEHILLYVYSGYTLRNEIRLRDGNLDDVSILNNQNTYYMRSGIKLKI